MSDYLLQMIVKIIQTNEKIHLEKC